LAIIAIIAIIGYYFFAKSFHIIGCYCDTVTAMWQAQTLFIAIIVTLLLQLLFPLGIVCIIGNYWQLLILIIWILAKRRS
jgi:uncharacterized membrane protein